MGKTLDTEGCKYIVELPSPPTKEYKFDCNDCGKQFAKLSRFKVHQATHLNEKTFKCSFEGCESTYYRKNHLKRHEATKHLIVGGGYKCTFDGCLASFESSSSLYFHNKKRHCEKKFSCPKCPEMFSKKYQLKEHTFEHASLTTSCFKCGVKGCNEEFRLHTLLKSHQKLHRRRRITGIEEEPQKTKTYPCLECDSIFEKWSLYLAHKKAHRVECPTCKKKFSKSHIRNHIKIHDEQRNVFLCPFKSCSRSYRHSQNLTHHIGTSHMGRAFGCNICNKQLSSKQKLDNHVKIIHDGAAKALPNINQDLILSRNKLISMLPCDPDFEIIRRGPVKGPRRCLKNDDRSKSKPPESLVSTGTDSTDYANNLCSDSSSTCEDFVEMQPLQSELICL